MTKVNPCFPMRCAISRWRCRMTWMTYILCSVSWPLSPGPLWHTGVVCAWACTYILEYTHILTFGERKIWFIYIYIYIHRSSHTSSHIGIILEKGFLQNFAPLTRWSIPLSPSSPIFLRLRAGSLWEGRDRWRDYAAGGRLATLAYFVLSFRPFDFVQYFEISIYLFSFSFSLSLSLQGILEPLLLRRTKETRQIDGTPIISLPSSTVAVVNLALTPAERQFYEVRLIFILIIYI